MRDGRGIGLRWGAVVVLSGLSLAAAGVALSAQPAPAPALVARENVYLAGIPVAGKSAEEVRRLADDLAVRLLRYPLVIRTGKHSHQTFAERLGAVVNPAAAAAAVMTASAEPAGLLERMREQLAGPSQRDVPLDVQLSEAGVARGLMRFSLRAGNPPQDARLTRVDGKFRATPPRNGTEIDSAAVVQLLVAALDAPQFRERLAASLATEPSRSRWLQAQAPMTLQAPLREARPRITLEQLGPITHRLATFGTSLGASSRNRLHNIRLACQAVDGVVLLPGDVFSYNDIVGPRVPSAGYREAPVIVRGELQPGTGGGICQLSSTLYNAALLADLEIVRRSRHAFPVTYVPPGRDATVVDGVVDFQFRNRLSHPIAIDAKVIRNRVVLDLYGHPADQREIEIRSSRVTRVRAGTNVVTDPQLAQGRRVTLKRARDGRRVTITRVVKKEGAVVRTEVVSRDYYRPFNGVVRVGTRSTAPRPAPEAPETAPAPPAPGIEE